MHPLGTSAGPPDAGVIATVDFDIDQPQPLVEICQILRLKVRPGEARLDPLFASARPPYSSKVAGVDLDRRKPKAFIEVGEVLLLELGPRQPRPHPLPAGSSPPTPADSPALSPQTAHPHPPLHIRTLL